MSLLFAPNRGSQGPIWRPQATLNIVRLQRFSSKHVALVWSDLPASQKHFPTKLAREAARLNHAGRCLPTNFTVPIHTHKTNANKKQLTLGFSMPRRFHTCCLTNMQELPHDKSWEERNQRGMQQNGHKQNGHSQRSTSGHAAKAIRKERMISNPEDGYGALSNVIYLDTQWSHWPRPILQFPSKQSALKASVHDCKYYVMLSPMQHVQCDVPYKLEKVATTCKICSCNCTGRMIGSPMPSQDECLGLGPCNHTQF